VAGIAPAGPVSGVRGLQFVDDSPEAPPEVVTGNPWPSPAGPGYVASPLRRPGQMWSQGYGTDPILPDPETQLITQPDGEPNAAAAGPGTPYYDATPWTHAGPWIRPYDTTDPDQSASRQAESGTAHADGLDNRKPGLNIAAGQDDWAEYYSSPPGGTLVRGARDQDKTSAGWGSADSSAFPANVNDRTDFAQHNHRRVACGRNLPMDFLWMPGGQRPLVSTVHGLQALPVGPGGAFEGQDPAYGYGTAGAVLTRPAGDYEPPVSPYQPGPLSAQGLREGPL
jgi:hypothetical protein